MDPALRVSTEERNAAVERLREHYLAGRLDTTEFEARVTTAHGARDGADLVALFRDLPAETTAAPAVNTRRRRLRYLVLRYLLTSAFVVAVWAATGRHGSFWPVWPIVVGGLYTGRRVLAVLHHAEEDEEDGPRLELPRPPGL